MSYSSYNHKRRRFAVESFNITQGQTGYRLTGYINDTLVLERHFFQQWKALEVGNEWLNQANWTDFFIRPYAPAKRFGKY